MKRNIKPLITANNSYVADLPSDLKENLIRDRLRSRREFRKIDIPVEALTGNQTQWLHAVEATRDYNTIGDPVIKIRIIAEAHGGVNVTIPLDSREQEERYLSLRHKIRNSDRVMVTFSRLSVAGSPRPREIFLKAEDFKIFDPRIAEQLNNPAPILDL